MCTEGALTLKEERNKKKSIFCLSTYREAHAKSHGEPPPFSCTSFPTLPLLPSEPILSQNESEIKTNLPWPETNHVSRVYNIAAILWLQLMVHVMVSHDKRVVLLHYYY